VTKLDALLLRILAGLVALLAVGFVTWAPWVTVTLFTLEKDLAVLKVANHLALEVPALHARAREEPRLASPALDASRFIAAPKIR